MNYVGIAFLIDCWMYEVSPNRPVIALVVMEFKGPNQTGQIGSCSTSVEVLVEVEIQELGNVHAPHSTSLVTHF